MGVGTVSRTKLELEKPREILGGLPLIRTAKRPNPKGGKDYDEITLTDIWPANSIHFASSPLELDPDDQVPEGYSPSSSGELASSTVEQKKNSKEEDKKNGASNFLSGLRSDPLYSHVDFDSEIGKMRRWLSLPANTKRRLTERFVINWLNKIDRPVEIPEKPPTETTLSRLEKEAELKKKMGWDKLERTA